MRYYYGLDLGQAQDHSASVILEAHGEGDTRTYDCRFIEQHLLGTSYPALVRAVGALWQRPPLRDQCQLAIDHTGVGRPIFDLFTEAGLRPVGITITGGSGWHKETTLRWHVAKIQLVGIVQKFLQSGRLRIAASLPQAKLLQQELKDFRVKISKAANETYEARESAHDDVVLALSMSLWVGEHPINRWLPVGT
jgi:hypothetical protein